MLSQSSEQCFLWKNIQVVSFKGFELLPLFICVFCSSYQIGLLCKREGLTYAAPFCLTKSCLDQSSCSITGVQTSQAKQPILIPNYSTLFHAFEPKIYEHRKSFYIYSVISMWNVVNYYYSFAKNININQLKLMLKAKVVALNFLDQHLKMS